MSATTVSSTSTATAPSAAAPSAPALAPTQVIEQLPANIPRLEPDGSNWVIFIVRFQEAMEVTRRWGYFNGSVTRPTPKDPDNPTDREEEAMSKWDYDVSAASDNIQSCTQMKCLSLQCQIVYIIRKTYILLYCAFS